VTRGAAGASYCGFFEADKKQKLRRWRESLELKTAMSVLAFTKISSPTLAGDFGARVACASKHHFFLDITF